MEGLVTTIEQLREEVEYFLQFDAFAWDTETMPGPEGEGTRGIPTQNRVVWISMATYGRAIVIPMGHPNGNVHLNKDGKKRFKNKETGKFENIAPEFDAPPAQLRPSQVFDALRPLFFSNRMKIAHNATFDFISVAKHFGDIPYGPMSDSIVLQWLLDENIGTTENFSRKAPRDKGLKTLTKWYYNVDYDKEEVGKCIEAHPFNVVARYALLDAKYTWLLWKRFDEWCQEQGLSGIRELEEAVTPVCCDMGLIGAPVDAQAIQELDQALTQRLVEIETLVYRAAKKQFNINSPKQKQEILYGFKKDGGQGLKPTKLTKTAKDKKKKDPSFKPDIYSWSTDQEALEDFHDNELVKQLLAYAEVSKLRSTYVRGYLGDPDDPIKKPCLIFNGRIHTDLVQYGTVSGRFSSRAPNLQNIPAPNTELGKKVRGLFRAPKGYKLLVADYGQMELRILASYIGHGGLYDGFQAGIDAHTQTAALVFGKMEEFKADPKYFKRDENKWMRSAAKTLNFAIVYGAGPDKVASMLGMTIDEAKELLANHRVAFPEIYAFKAAVIKKAKSREIPHIKTIMGRIRRVWDLHVTNRDEQWKVWRAERQLFNSLIQGSLGDIIKLAMVRLHELLKEDAKENPGKEIQLILSVHDELVLTCPEERVSVGSALLRQAMLGSEIQDLIGVPLDVGDVAVCDRWSDAKE
ncbi:DNA polymerase [Streptomyces phage BRock]|uniref:DNA polymerase n=1 Tax=Streptomyces phage BRock TaxID=1913591 RepID=A0A1J0GVZ7_9CAUD|nr:DNA polymerase [Streptomyces phage BRock]APC46347.2 DNA polymerase I [Streptomyces phage BRock]